MKKLNICYLIILFIFPFKSFTQNLQIDWGDNFDSKTEVQKILGFIEGKMYGFSMKKKNSFIDIYSEDGFKYIKSIEYEVPKFSKHESGLLNIAAMENDILALVYKYDNRNSSFTLLAQRLSTSGEQVGDLKEIYSSTPLDTRIKKSIVDVRFSPDNKKALVFFDRTDKDKLTFYSDVIVIDLFDSNLNSHTKNLTFPMKDEKSDKSDFSIRHVIDNEGNYFFINEKIEYDKRSISNFQLEILAFNNGQEIGSLIIDDQESMLLKPAIVKANDGFLVVGYYQSNPKRNAMVTGYAGLFTAKLSKSLSLVEYKKSEFSKDFFLKLFSQRKVERMIKNEKEILVPAPYTMDQIIIHSDGSYTVLSEYFLITEIVQQGAKSTNTNYGNIIYYKLNSEGNIVNSDIIKKNQMSTTQTMSVGMSGPSSFLFVGLETKDKMKKYWSYATFVKNDVVYLIFNDHQKNEEDEDGEISRTLVNPRKSYPYLAVINLDGSYTKNAMIEADDDETYCVPQVVFRKNADEFVIWGVKRKINKFGLGTIN